MKLDFKCELRGHRPASSPSRQVLPERTKTAWLYPEWGPLESGSLVELAQVAAAWTSEKTDRADSRLLKPERKHADLFFGFPMRRFRFLAYLAKPERNLESCCSASYTPSSRWRLAELSSDLAHPRKKAPYWKKLAAGRVSPKGSCAARLSR